MEFELNRVLEKSKLCRNCKKVITRVRFNGRLEDLSVFKRRRNCSLKCANTRKHPTHWETYHYRARKFRKAFCEACGITVKLHAHHKDKNIKNNTEENIQTLCIHCHKFLHDLEARLNLTGSLCLPNLLMWLS